MPTIDSVYQSLYGCGYLILDEDLGPSAPTDFRLVLDIDDYTGGGFLFNLSEEDAREAARLIEVPLSLGTVGDYLKLIVGSYYGDANWLPVVALGRTTGPVMLTPFEAE